LKKKSVAIITARGGSKRIPRKNVKNFLGKPILLYSIEAAINSGIFDTTSGLKVSAYLLLMLILRKNYVLYLMYYQLVVNME